MFAKRLIIQDGEKIIRDIKFKKGLNLIVDETSADLPKTKSGNSVGKTTILKLIDLCLGDAPKHVYTDEVEKNKIDEEVKKYLIDNEVIIIFVMGESFENDENDIVITRNFLPRSKPTINGQQIDNEEFPEKLKSLIFIDLKDSKPTLRQLVSHNIRYSDYSINNTVKSLDPYTKNIDYEALYLYMLGFNMNNYSRKIELDTLMKQESNYKKRLEKKETKSSLETKLDYLNSQIKTMEHDLAELHVDDQLSENIDRLDRIKYEISMLYSKNSNLLTRKNLILSSIEQINGDKVEIDTNALNQIYTSVAKLNIRVTKSFEDLVIFHNSMIDNKTKFFNGQLPIIDSQIGNNKRQIDELIIERDKLNERIKCTRTLEQLNSLSSEIGLKYQSKGEIEAIISQINECEDNYNGYDVEYKSITSEIYSDDFIKGLKETLNKFNHYFSSFSKKLYDEDYILTYDITMDKSTSNKCITFKTISPSISSGKKQGEALAFDLAYIEFAQDNSIPHLDFLLNDKKELMHGNQLTILKDYCDESDIQVIIPILKEKLPESLKQDKYIVLSLNQDDKLFRIESKKYDYLLKSN